MLRHAYWLVLLTAAAWMTGCSPSVNVEQEKSALLARDREWSQSVKDIEKFLSFYAADATVYLAGMPKATGPQAIRTAWSEMLSAPGGSVQWAAEKAEVSAAGDVGYTTGAYKMTMNNAAGNPATETGKYVTTWRKQPDGQWKVAEDIGNSDAPPPPPSSAHVMVTSSAVKWGDAPPSLPPGAKLAVLSGDPSKPAPFTIRAQFPAGYRIAPHWHPTDEHVTVLAGTVALGMGEKFDQAALADLSAGGYTAMPATMRHYLLSKTASTIQVEGMGPFVVNYVNPADDPSKK